MRKPCWNLRDFMSDPLGQRLWARYGFDWLPEVDENESLKQLMGFYPGLLFLAFPALINPTSFSCLKTVCGKAAGYWTEGLQAAWLRRHYTKEDHS
jgi:hypothetical protein